MGAKAAVIKMGVRAHESESPKIDNPYTHLAVSIIIQAYDDLKALKGADEALIEQSAVSKWEILNFFRSDWCGFLLSCQGAVTQERLKEKVMSII